MCALPGAPNEKPGRAPGSRGISGQATESV
jgi:hypothetical protein